MQFSFPISVSAEILVLLFVCRLFVCRLPSCPSQFEKDDHDGLIARIAGAIEGELRIEDMEDKDNQEDAVVIERPWREAE